MNWFPLTVFCQVDSDLSDCDCTKEEMIQAQGELDNVVLDTPPSTPAATNDFEDAESCIETVAFWQRWTTSRGLMLTDRVEFLSPKRRNSFPDAARCDGTGDFLERVCDELGVRRAPSHADACSSPSYHLPELHHTRDKPDLTLSPQAPPSTPTENCGREGSSLRTHNLMFNLLE